jgi:hypothetical protein
LGRAVTENEKKGDFHILDYEPEMTEFVQISVDAHAAVAIDEDGELWILAGQQTYSFNLNLQSKDKNDRQNPERKVGRPIKTNWMRKLNLKATKVKVGSTMILIETINDAGKKGLHVFKGEHESDNTPGFKKLV